MSVAELYRDHQPRVLGLLLRMTGGDRDRAEDLSQETWLRVLRAYSNFRGQAAIGTWIHRIAVNLALQERRSESARSRALEGWHAERNAPEPRRSDPFLRNRLGSLLELLPEGKRKVLVLHDAHGWTHEEVGRELGCTDGTSRSQLHKARAMMRAELGEREAWLAS